MNPKRGETYKQLLKRANYALDSIHAHAQDLENNLAGEFVINPRTKNSYKAEAEFMFRTLAIIEAELRGTDSNVLVAVRETLEQLGFNIVDQYENKCLKDGAYNV